MRRSGLGLFGHGKDILTVMAQITQIEAAIAEISSYGYLRVHTVLLHYRTRAIAWPVLVRMRAVKPFTPNRSTKGG